MRGGGPERRIKRKSEKKAFDGWIELKGIRHLLLFSWEVGRDGLAKEMRIPISNHPKTRRKGNLLHLFLQKAKEQENGK